MTALVSASGTISNDYRYDPWGTSIVATGTAYNPFQYIRAYRHSGLANLYHMGARGYQPSSGRFTRLDPHLKKLLTVNRYAYAGCDPVNKSDPSGLHEEYDAWDCAVGVLAGYSLGLAGLFVAAGGIVLAGGSITLWGVTFGAATFLTAAGLLAAKLLELIAPGIEVAAFTTVMHACGLW